MPHPIFRFKFLFSILLLLAISGFGVANGHASEVIVKLSMNEPSPYYGVTVKVIPPTGVTYVKDSCVDKYTGSATHIINAEMGTESIFSAVDPVTGPYEIMECQYLVSETFGRVPVADDFNVEGSVTTDQIGNSKDVVRSEFSFAVATPAENHVPSVTSPISSQDAVEDEPFNFQFSDQIFHDEDNGDTLTYEVSLDSDTPVPSWLSFEASTRTFSGTPLRADVETLNIKVTATDPAGASASTIFTIIISAATDGGSSEITVTLSMSETTPYYGLTVKIVPPEGVTYITDSCVDQYSGSATHMINAEIGTESIFSASDPIAGPYEIMQCRYLVTASFGRVPVVDDFNVEGSVTTDQIGNSKDVVRSEFSFAVTQNDAPPVENHTPQVAQTIPDQSAAEDTSFSFQFSDQIFHDEDADDTLTYAASLEDDTPLPSWLSFEASTRTFSGTPADAGTVNIKVTATDPAGATISTTFSVAVSAADGELSKITIKLSMNEDTSYYGLTVKILPPEGVTYITDSCVDQYTGSATAILNAEMGTESIFSAVDPIAGPYEIMACDYAVATSFGRVPVAGDFNVEGTVTTDQIGSSKDVVQSEFSFVASTDETLPPENHAPTVSQSISDQSAVEDTPFSFQFSNQIFHDEDEGDTLTYAASLEDDTALPSWLSFETSTRTFSGTPLNVDVGTISIKVTGTDPVGATVSITFSVVVSAATDGELSEVTVTLSMNETTPYYGLTVKIIPPEGVTYIADSCIDKYTGSATHVINAEMGTESIFSAVDPIAGPYEIMECRYLVAASFGRVPVVDDFNVEGSITTDQIGNSKDVVRSEFSFTVIQGDAPPIGTDRVTVSGKITNPSGVGIEGLLVEIHPEFDPNSENNGEWAKTVTDADGNFNITAVSGHYRIKFLTKYWGWDEETQTEKEVIVLGADGKPLNLASGFIDMNGKVTTDRDAAKLFTVFSSQTIDLKTEANIALEGHIQTISEGGTKIGVVGAEVNVRTLDSSHSFWATTEEDGFFSVSVTPNRRYVVEVWPQWCDDQTPAEEFEACKANRVDFMGGKIVVTKNDIVDSSGSPLVDAEGKSTVIARNKRGEPVITASVANAADTTIHGKILNILEPEKVTQFEVDQLLHLMPMIDMGTAFTGHLKDADGHGVSDAWVESSFGGVSTDTTGNFTLTLPASSDIADTFKLHIWSSSNAFMGGMVVSSEGGHRLSTDETNTTSFKLDGSDWPVDGLIVQTSDGISITGRVTDGTQGVPDIWVNAWSHLNDAGSGSVTDADGRYSIRVEPPAGADAVYYEVGIWTPDFVAPEPVLAKVEASGMTGVYAIKTGSREPRPGNPIDVSSDPRLDFSLSQGKVISGRVVDDSGKGLPWVWVDIHDRRFTKFFGANTDENGFYEAQVEPGRYVAVVWGEGGMRDTWYNQATDERDATAIDVRTGSQENINFRMTSGATISGTITGGTSGTVFIEAWSEHTQSWAGTEVALDSDSVVFTLSGLKEADDYRVSFHPDNYMSGFFGGTLDATDSVPVGRRKATLINTTNGNVTGVNISLDSGKTLVLSVTGMSAGEEVGAHIWSESLGQGGWAESKVDAETDVATLIIKDLEASGTDYRLFIEPFDSGYRVGNFKGTPVTTTDSDLTDGDSTVTNPGTLVGWGQATLINMADNVSVTVTMDSGGTISGSVSGLASGQEAWVSAYSERTTAWGEVAIIADDNGQVDYTIKGLKRAKDFRVDISGDGVKSGFYAGPGSTALTNWNSAVEVDIRSAPIGEGDAAGIDLVVSSGVSISGSIKGSEDGNGLQSGEWAWVDAWSDSTFSWAGVSVEADPETSGATVSYQLEGLASASDYEVSLDVHGYKKQSLEGIDVTKAVTDIDFTLSTTASKITGSISNLTPLSNAWVDALSRSTSTWGGVGIVADANGSATYTIDGLSEANDYVVTLYADNGMFFYKADGLGLFWSNASSVTVTSGTTESIDFDLSSSALFKLSGTVTLEPDSDDQIVDISAWSVEGGFAHTSRTGGGDFTLTGLPSGDYAVDVSTSSYIGQRTQSMTVTSGVVDDSSMWTSGWNDAGTVPVTTDTTGLNVTLSTGYTLSGTVKDTSGRELSGVRVSAWDSTNARGSGTTTNANGSYTVEGLPNGTYDVSVWTKDGEISESQEVTADTTLDLTLVKAAGGISGTVVNSSQVAVSAAMVLVFDASGAQVGVAVTDSSGAFKVEGLTPGQTYAVKVYGDENFSTINSYKATTVEVTDSMQALDTLELSNAASPGF